MKISEVVFLIYWLVQGYCTSDVHIGYQVSLAIPTSYCRGFMGRAFLMESENQMVPNFRAAISVEANNEKYTCSLDVLLGDVKVWSSGHLSKFYTIDKCVLQLTQYGDLLLTGQDDRVGWKAGTSRQGVERLHLLGTGKCSCIRLIKRGDGLLSDCAENVTEGFCGRNRSQMLQLQGVMSVLRSNPYKVNVSKEMCANLCLDNCTCVAALHFSLVDSEDDHTKPGECYLYGLARGVKQIQRDGRLSYMVKVPAATDQDHDKHSHWKKRIPIVVGVVDGIVLLLVLGGIGYYVIRKRRKQCAATAHSN
ncbi:uncharacterized protein LOC107857337 isoform X3 [Capsicum annuum]|uniref:uncharacterized protein LOC107857337 isoform X3 n=1 Tax=Capsicum annuum TaxID=4072 RepID=UPI001FB18A9E|nr:uncharacterized protein LOC107857337 isoform X3 [Capsicum annuum]